MVTLFSGYFDTLIGGKKEPLTYSNIAKNIDIPPEHLLFLSDIKDELDAVKADGYQTVWLVREGGIEAKADHLQVSSFDQISL
jgi:Predicted enolase-phosphatase